MPCLQYQGDDEDEAENDVESMSGDERKVGGEERVALPGMPLSDQRMEFSAHHDQKGEAKQECNGKQGGHQTLVIVREGDHREGASEAAR